MNTILELLRSPAAERIAWVLVHSLWQLALLAGAYALVGHMLRRRSAAARYLAGCAIMACMVLVLPLTALFVSVQAPNVAADVRPDGGALPAVPAIGKAALPVPMVEAAPPIETAPVDGTKSVSPSVAHPPQAESVAPPVTLGWNARVRDSLAPALPWIVAAWLVGVLVLALRQLGGWVAVRRLCGAGTAPVDGTVVRKMRRIADKLGVRRAVRLLSSVKVDVPSVVGHFKPVILLPVSLLSGLSTREIEAILAHELAHIRRHDYLVNLIQTTCETILFYHPVVWWISREIRRERENCCDDLAVGHCGDRVAYARALATLEESRASIPATAMAATGGSLIDRIRRIIGHPDASHTPRGTWLAGALAMFSVCVILPIALAVGGGQPDDFNFNDPPGAYEKGVRMAKRDQSIKAGGLRFKLSDVTRNPDGTLEASLGLKNGYEVVSFRLFDHTTRTLFHDSEWQLHLTNHPSTRKFQAIRVGETERICIEETGGTIPGEIDLWLRVVENGPGDRILIPARNGASAKHDKSEVVITSLLAGRMNGKGSPSGKMIWDLTAAHDTTCASTINLENRGKLLRGRYHLVAVTKKGWRHAMNHKHFIDFSRHGRHNYVMLDVAPGQIDHFELIPFKTRHKFFFNGVEVPGTVLPELSRKQKREMKRWVGKAENARQSEFDGVVDALVAMGPGVAGEMIPLLKHGGTDRLGIKVLEAFAPDPAVQQKLIQAIEEAREKGTPNVIHCVLIVLGRSENRDHVDFIAKFLETHDIAAMSALTTLGGDRARDHLIRAFDTVPTEHWFVLAGNLERLGDPAAVPELKKRLGQVELPPNERFPNATVGAMTDAIAALSGQDGKFTTTSFSQGQHFRYPFGRPGAPKTFSVNLLRDHYVRLPKVDPKSKTGREAIWMAMEEATEGPGFTIDGNEVVVFHGLKMAPLWPDGAPYPTTLYDWLRRTSHQELRKLVDEARQAVRYKIPDNGLLVSQDPAGRLYVLSLQKTSDQFTYDVTVMPQDPNMQLIPTAADTGALRFTEVSGCTLHDLESETKDGALNLSRGHLETMTPKKWNGPPADAILVAEFVGNELALAVPGAERCLLAEADDAWEKPENVLALLKAATTEEPKIAGHKIVKREEAIFHVFPELRKDRKFAFAVKMPDGNPVAGVMEVQKIDRKAETLVIRHRFLPTAAAREVFAKEDAETGAESEITTGGAKEMPKGLEFLAGIPEFSDLRLDMTELQFKEMIKHHPLAVQDGLGNKGQATHYTLKTPTGQSVIVMFLDGQCSGIQRMRDTPVWGKAVDGVQCRLEAEQKGCPSGEAPRFRVFARNRGERELLLYTSMHFGCRVEFDGQWYEYWAPQEAVGQAWHPAKKWERDGRALEWSLVARYFRGVDNKQPLLLQPGKHTVRFAWAAYHSDYKTNPPDERPPVRLMSNPVEILIIAQEAVEEASSTPRFANPAGLDDETLIKLFRTGAILRRVAWDCEAFQSDRKRLPEDVPDLASRYQERSRAGFGLDPFAPNKKLRLILSAERPNVVQVWSVGPDGKWDGGKQIDSIRQPLVGDLGAEIRVGNTDWHWLADKTMQRHLEGKRLAQYLAAKGPKLPKPELKDDGLEWGPVVDGLQLAVELKPKRQAFLFGETIDVRFHVRNAADYAIQVGLVVPMEQDMTEQSVFIRDKDGKRLKGNSSWFSGIAGTKQRTLKPGESASYESSDLAFVAPGKRPGTGAVGHWVEAAPGVYTVQFKQHFPTGFSSEPRQWQGVLETAPVTVRIAEQPKFSIHRVRAYRKPGNRPGEVQTIYLRDSGKPERFDAMRPERYPLKDLVIDGTPLLTESDILAYDLRSHTIKLKPGVHQRLGKAFKPSVWGVPFVVQAEGEPVYLGAFWSPGSSHSASMPTISLIHFNSSLPKNDPEYLAKDDIRIENARFLKPGELPGDPRQNERLYKALQKTGKLLDLRSGELPWGKTVEKIQSRLRPGLFRDGYQWLTFDLRNDSDGLSVQLGPGGMPPELLIDNVPYRWLGNVTGHLPICKPGRRVTDAQFKLDENWMPIKTVSGEKTLKLIPGKHTVQAIVYAGAMGPGRRPVVRVLSNPVEIEIVAESEEVGGGGKDGTNEESVDESAEIPQKTTVRGTVVDDATGEPVGRFITQDGKFDPADPSDVTWGYSETHSGRKDGKFSATVRWPEGWTARIVADGYIPQPVLTKAPLPGQDVIELVIRLKRGELVKGRVLDHKGEPVKGAGVFAIGPTSLNLSGGKALMDAGESGEENTRARPVYTDDAGRFELPAGAATRLAVSCTGLDVWPLEIPKEGEALVRLPAPATVSIKYDIEGGDPEGMVAYQLLGHIMPGFKGLESMRSHTIKNGGRLDLTGMTPGKYQFWRGKKLRIGDTGHGAMLDRQFIEIKPGEKMTINYVRENGARLRGKVTWPSETKFSGVVVSVKSTKSWKNPFDDREWDTTYASTKAAADGSFATERIAPGCYLLVAEGYVPLTDRQRNSTGWIRPAYTAETTITVPESGGVTVPDLKLTKADYGVAEKDKAAKTSPVGAAGANLQPGVQAKPVDFDEAARKLTEAVGGRWRVANRERAPGLGAELWGALSTWHGVSVPYIVLPFPLNDEGRGKLDAFRRQCSAAVDDVASDDRWTVLAGPSREPDVTRTILGTLGMAATEEAGQRRRMNAWAEWLDFRLAVARHSGRKFDKPLPLLDGPNLAQIDESKDLFARKGPNGGRHRGDPYQWFPELDICDASPLLVRTDDRSGTRYLLLSNKPEEVLLSRSARPRPWHLKRVETIRDDRGRIAIALELDETSARRMRALTAPNPGRPLAVLFHDNVLAVHTIREKPEERLVLSRGPNGFDPKLAGRIVRSLSECMVRSESPVDTDPVMTKQILPILQSLKEDVEKLGEEFPQLAGAKAVDANPDAWLFEHDCRYMGKRGYENTGPFPVAIGLRVMTTDRFREQSGKVAMSFPGYRWEYLGLVGWPTLHAGEEIPPVLVGKLQDALRKTMAKIGPLNRRALAATLPEPIQKERDRLLAEADAKIREGVQALAEQYPLLKKGQSWDRLKVASGPGRIGIHFHRTQRGKGRTDKRAFPPVEAFSILVVIKLPPDEIEQLVLGPMYPRLGLVGQVGTGAGDPELDAALKKLVTDALAPLSALEERAAAQLRN